MTIEFSLRRRAKQARLLAALWLTIATVILVCAYVSLPHVADTMLNFVSKNNESISDAKKIENATDQPERSGVAHVQIFVMATLVLGFSGIIFICFLLGRAFLFEMALSARFSGLADSLCISGNEFEKFEKAASLLVPKAEHLSVPEILSAKDVKELLNLLRSPR